MPTPIKDITGQKFGSLTAVKRVGKNKWNMSLWLCICECGNEKIATIGNLRSGGVKSCGCAHRSHLEGKRFGRLNVMSFNRVENNTAYWNCICDCGNIASVSTYNLQGGLTKSCGCLMIEKARKRLVIINSKRGKEHHNYNDNLTDNDRARQTNPSLLRDFRKLVYSRDDYTCQKCGYNRHDGIKKKRREFHAHHIESWNSNKEERFNIANAITLCKECHIEFHNEYGRGNNTREQLSNFINFVL